MVESDRLLRDAAAPAVPERLRAAESEDLLGVWVPPGVTALANDRAPHVEFRSAATWKGSDGCNGLGGRWTVSRGVLLLAGLTMTAVGCENINVTEGAALAAFDGETLVLLGEDGKETFRLSRLGNSDPVSAMRLD